MSFEVPANVERDVEGYAENAHLTTSEALIDLIQAGLERKGERTIGPAEAGGGMFSGPKDAALLDAAVELICEERRQPSHSTISVQK